MSKSGETSHSERKRYVAGRISEVLLHRETMLGISGVYALASGLRMPQVRLSAQLSPCPMGCTSVLSVTTIPQSLLGQCSTGAVSGFCILSGVL